MVWFDVSSPLDLVVIGRVAQNGPVPFVVLLVLDHRGCLCGGSLGQERWSGSLGVASQPGLAGALQDSPP
jgi:hypothetical protein